MSQVTKVLLDLTQRRNFYAGDLLSSVEILRNVTDTFKRASYEPSSDDVQVNENTMLFFYYFAHLQGYMCNSIHLDIVVILGL